MRFTLTIPTGTKVLRDDSTVVTLQGAVIVDGATREADGGFTYEVAGSRYFASAGTVDFREEVQHVWRHRDGLVAFA